MATLSDAERDAFAAIGWHPDADDERERRACRAVISADDVVRTEIEPDEQIVVGKRPSKSTTDAADAKIAEELQHVDLDAAVAQATADETTAAPKLKRGELTIPAGTSPRELILQFLTETCSAAPDAAEYWSQLHNPPTNAVTHAQRPLLDDATPLPTSTRRSRADCCARTRIDRPLPVVGAKTTRLSVWVIDAPRGTSQIERMPAPERKTSAKTTTPELSDADRSALTAAALKHASKS